MRLLASGSFRAVAARVALAMTAALAACADTPSKEEQEAARNTFTCQLDGERLVIRFDAGEARMLTSAGERIVLYQIAAPSGVRYTNGTYELRGKGTELQLIRDANATRLTDCQPYSAPK